MRTLDLSGFCTWITALVFLLAMPGPAAAQEWAAYGIGEVSFEVPAGWNVARRAENREIDFKSPDGATALAAFWWFPDEPLLAYDDVVGHEEITVAGRPALLIHSEFPELTILLLAFTERRAEGEQFLLRLEGYDKDFDRLSALMDGIMARIGFDGQKDGAEAGSPLRFGSDCFALDMATWKHPTRDVLAARQQAHLQWVLLCRDRVYPVFGVAFDFDPQGRTDDFFHPLYLDMLKANGNWPFSFVEVNDGLVISVAPDGGGGISIDHDPLSPAEKAALP